MDYIKDIFIKQRKLLEENHKLIISKLLKIHERLQQYCQLGCQCLDSGKYYVNQIFIKQIDNFMEEIQKTIQINGSKHNHSVILQSQQQILNTNDIQFPISNPYLIDIYLTSTVKDQQSKQLEQSTTDIIQFMQQNKDSAHVVLSKRLLKQTNALKLSLNCTNISSICLKSHRYKQQMIISDDDLLKLSMLKRLTSVDVSCSAITDSGISFMLDQLESLKQLNVSGCVMLTDQTIKKLMGNRLVNLKINQLNSVSEDAVLDFVTQSENLNYLEVRGSRHIDTSMFVCQISVIYDSNQSSFKWLELHSSIGTDLFINKLGYLTQVTQSQSISNEEVVVILGTQKQQVNGLYFSCCEQLNQQTVSLICRSVKNLKRLKLTKFVKLNDVHVREIVSQFVGLQMLWLDQCFSLTNISLKFVKNFLKKIKFLSISHCRTINDEGIQHLCSQSNNLQYINLSHLKLVTDQGISLISKNCNNLKSLIIKKCDQISDQSINQVSSNLTDLQQLVVNYCQNLTDSSLMLALTRLRNLARLQIQWCQVSQKCVSYIVQNLLNLKYLNLNFCPTVCDKQILLLSTRKQCKIQVLKLQSCDKISQGAFLQLSKTLHKIKHLQLRQCRGVTDNVITLFCINAQARLKFIDLSWCNVTDKSLFSISQYQNQLSYLNINGCKQISDIGLEWVITTLKGLQYLNISLCQKLTDRSVALIGSVKRLKYLLLSGLRKVTDVSISSFSQLTNLIQLQMSGCTQISSSSMLSLLNNLQKLHIFNINECPNIKTKFIAIMIDKLKNLRKLELCSIDIDDQFLDVMGKNLSKLQYLNVSFCGKITDNGMQILIQQIPSLLKVELQNTNISNRIKQKIVYTLNCRKMYNIMVD